MCTFPTSFNSIDCWAGGPFQWLLFFGTLLDDHPGRALLWARLGPLCWAALWEGKLKTPRSHPGYLAEFSGVRSRVRGARGNPDGRAGALCQSPGIAGPSGIGCAEPWKEGPAPTGEPGVGGGTAPPDASSHWVLCAWWGVVC